MKYKLYVLIYKKILRRIKLKIKFVIIEYIIYINYQIIYNIKIK